MLVGAVTLTVGVHSMCSALSVTTSPRPGAILPRKAYGRALGVVRRSNSPDRP